jgi:hypothetical protein
MQKCDTFIDEEEGPTVSIDCEDLLASEGSGDEEQEEPGTCTDTIFEVVEESKEEAVLKVATFNICEMEEKEEITETFDAILRYDPDVLAVQGLTKKNCDSVFRIMKAKSYSFSRFDQTGAPRDSFEILFTKNTVPVLKKEYTPFIKTNQNKGLSKYLVTASAQTQRPVNVWIFTSKFEEDAPGNAIRKVQILELNAEYDRVRRPSRAEKISTPGIFAGDTSIPSWQSSDSTLKCPDGWSDAWREKGTSQNEKTSLYDRMDQIWVSGDLAIVDFVRIRVNSSDDTRAGVCATFRAM